MFMDHHTMKSFCPSALDHDISVTRAHFQNGSISWSTVSRCRADVRQVGFPPPQFWDCNFLLQSPVPISGSKTVWNCVDNSALMASY